MTALVDFRKVAAGLPARQRAAYLALVPREWADTAMLQARTGDPSVGKRLAELEAKGLVESAAWYKCTGWRVVAQVSPVQPGRARLLELLRGMVELVNAPPPAFAMSEAQCELLKEVNAVLSEGTK